MSSVSKKKQRRRKRAAKPVGSTAAQQSADQPAGSGREAEQPAGSYSKQLPSIESKRPPAPWDPFPLVELLVLAGLVMVVVGFVIGLDETRGQAALMAGVVLASLGGLELAIREHVGGYRSHTTLLASAAAVGVLAVLYYVADVSGVPSLVAAAAVGVLAAVLLVRVFRARSGGRSVKLR